MSFRLDLRNQRENQPNWIVLRRLILSFLILLIACLVGFAATRKQTGRRCDWATYRDLQYGQDGAQRLDLFIPARKRGPLPLIVFIHGGGWAAGDKADATFFELPKRGYALASINYRLMRQAPFPAQISDCKAAIRYLRSNAKVFNLDPNRIGVWGSSCGGHLAMLLATTGDGEVPEWDGQSNVVSSRIQAVCDWAGPSDLVSLLHSKGLNSKMRNCTKNLVGPPGEGRERKWSLASPVRYVNEGDPPALVMHAEGDQMVPISQSEELVDCLKAYRVHCEFIKVKAGEHCFYSVKNEAIVGDFFDRFLKRSDTWAWISNRARRMCSPPVAKVASVSTY